MPTMVPTKIAMRCSYSCIEEGPARFQAREPRAHHGSVPTMRMPPEARSKLLTMLCAFGVDSPSWWWDVLVGGGDPPYKPLA